MSKDGVEVWRGSVAAWECDHMGHMNVGFYVAKASEALVGLAAVLGMPEAFAPDARATLIVQDQHIRFLKEARPGAALHMTGGVVEVGEDSARLAMLLHHGDGSLAASFQTLVVHATAREGRPFPWPGQVRARLDALGIETPEAAAPRSISLDPVESRASLQRADELGLKRTALGAISSADCDVFGRMRPEMMMARISDGIPHFFDGGRPGAGDGRRVGGAALEYRLLHLDWPRAGDRVELRSGSAGGDARFRRLVHWLVDPLSGRAWGAAEAIAASFDLDTRKIITLTGDDLARVEAEAVSGLSL